MRGYELVRIYRDEGVSARSDRLDKRPGLVALLEDASAGDVLTDLRTLRGHATLEERHGLLTGMVEWIDVDLYLAGRGV